MAPFFTGLAKNLGGYGFGRSAAAASAPVPTDIVIANLSSTSVGTSGDVNSTPITLPPTFTKLVIFGISGGGGVGHRNDGDDGGGGGGGGAGNITGYEIPFASVVGSTITVAAGYGGEVVPNGPTGGTYGSYTGNGGGPSYISHTPGYLWRALGGGGGQVSTNGAGAPARVGGSGGTMSTGTGTSGGAGGTGMSRGGGTSQSQNANPGIVGGGGGGGAWGGPESNVRGTAGIPGSNNTYITPDGKTTITFTAGSGTNLAKDGRPDADSKAGGYTSAGWGYSFSSTLPTPTHPAPITSPGYQHGGAGGGQNGYNASANSPWTNYGRGGGGFIVVVAIGVPL